MANELSITVGTVYQKGNSSEDSKSYSKEVTVAGNVSTGHRVSVGTSEEVLPLGEVTAAGALLIGKNMDDTNYLEIRYATGASFDVIKVPAGEPVCFRFGSDVTAPYVIANTAAVLFEYTLYPA